MLAAVACVTGGLALAIIAVVILASRRPATFCVTRSIDIAAPAEHIYPLIANLRSMNTWNPFVAPDPAIKVDYLGPDMGPGAAHTWSGNRTVGEGRIDVTDVVEPSRVAMRLQMVKPMRADNSVEFTLSPAGTGTNVTWSMSGRQPLIGKIMTLFIDCDRMVGGQFDKGLAKLKGLAEA